VLDQGAFVPPEVVAARALDGRYYASGVGDAIPALLPPMARGGRADAHKTARVSRSRRRPGKSSPDPSRVATAGLKAPRCTLEEAVRCARIDCRHAGRCGDGRAVARRDPGGHDQPASRGWGWPVCVRIASTAIHLQFCHSVRRRAMQFCYRVRPHLTRSDPHLTPIGPDGGTEVSGRPLRALARAGEFRVALLHGVTAAARPRSICAWPPRRSRAGAAR